MARRKVKKYNAHNTVKKKTRQGNGKYSKIPKGSKRYRGQGR